MEANITSRTAWVAISVTASLLLCSCSKLPALEEQFPAIDLEPEYVSNLPDSLRLQVLTAIAAAAEGRDYCLFLTSEKCAPCRAMLAHAEEEGVRDRIDALVYVTAGNYRYIRHMYTTHLGITLESQPVVPQVVLTRNGTSELYGGFSKGGRIADSHNHLHIFAELLKADQPHKSFQRTPTVSRSGPVNSSR